jgi:hypothetical protein
MNKDLSVFKQNWGISFDGAVDFIKPEWKSNYKMAADAQPTLVTTPNSGIPQFLTAFIDPDLLRIATAKNRAAEIFGEVKKGTFTDVTAIFPVVEHTGEVSSYGDFNANGHSSANTNFPTRESYLYQTIVEYGELEMERQGLAKIGWAAEVRNAAVTNLNKYQNLTYFYGVAGLANYGLLNDPSLSAPIAPAPKAAGGVQWWNGTALNATANEIYADIQALFNQLVAQSSGNIDSMSELVLALSPKSATALLTTNSFNVNVHDLLKKNLPNLRIESAVQYGVITAQNPQGSAAGEVVQLIATRGEGQETGYCAFNEKLRGGAIIRDLSSFKQKLTQGTFGCVIRQPFGISQMLGV